MNKKIMLIGQSKCGKTTLLQGLDDAPLHYKKTQMLDFQYLAIDTPGEYIENPRLYSALISTSCDADMIAFVQSANNTSTIFAPQFSTAFNKPVIGIITKIDLATKQEYQQAKQILQQAGVKKIFLTSAYQNIGLEKLRKYLNWTKQEVLT